MADVDRELDAELASVAKAQLRRNGVPLPSAPVSARSAERIARGGLTGTPLAGAGSTISSDRRRALAAFRQFPTEADRRALGKGIAKMRKRLDAGVPANAALWAGWTAHRKAGGTMAYSPWARMFRGDS